MGLKAIQQSTKIKSVQEAIQLANEIERFESATKLLKADLKEFVEVHGAVDTGKKIWDIRPVERFSFNPEQLKNVAKNIAMEGKNPWEYLSITNANLEKLGWADEVIAGMSDVKRTHRFSSRVKK